MIPSCVRSSLPILVVLALATPALADRTTSITVSATLDARGSGSNFDTAGTVPVHMLGGARITLGFEDAPVPIPAPGGVAAGFRVVPELLAGFLGNDLLVEGFVGAGLRAELQLASHRRGVQMRTAIYTAARAEVIGKHQDGAAELVLGESLWLHCGARLGWEGGAIIRPHDRDGERELDAVITFYIGWSR